MLSISPGPLAFVIISDQFIRLYTVLEKKTEAVSAYLIKNSKGGGGGGVSLSQAVGRTGRSCMGV